MRASVEVSDPARPSQILGSLPLVAAAPASLASKNDVLKDFLLCVDTLDPESKCIQDIAYPPAHLHFMKIKIQNLEPQTTSWDQLQ